MITTELTRRGETEAVLRGQFPDTSPPARIHYRGTWLGTGSKLLHLQNPILPGPLKNLLEGRTPAGVRALVPDYDAPDRVVAWLFTFTPPADLLADWKAAPELTRPNLVAAQGKAVAATLARFDGRITGHETASPGENIPTAIFAAFREQDSLRHQASVRTKVFFINQGYFTNRTVRTYATSEVVKAAAGLELFYVTSLRDALAQQTQRNRPRHFPALPRAERSEAPTQSPVASDQASPSLAPQRTPARGYRHSY